MGKLRDEGAGRRDLPQHVSGLTYGLLPKGMHLRAQPFNRCLTSEPDNESKPTQDDARSMSESGPTLPSDRNRARSVHLFIADLRRQHRHDHFVSFPGLSATRRKVWGRNFLGGSAVSCIIASLR
jgi:hypothetical protein